MSTQFLMARDISGFPCPTNSDLPFAQDGESALLAASTEQHIVVPDNYPWWLAVICVQQSDNTVYVDGITTAVVPSGAFAASTAEIIPAIGLTRYVKAGQTLSFITADVGGATVTVKYYVANTYTNVSY